VYEDFGAPAGQMEGIGYRKPGGGGVTKSTAGGGVGGNARTITKKKKRDTVSSLGKRRKLGEGKKEKTTHRKTVSAHQLCYGKGKKDAKEWTGLHRDHPRKI